jgi:hypothetical protein
MAKRFLSGINTEYVTGLENPLLPADATNKQYVDNLINRKYMKKYVDEINKNLLYIGEANPGSADNAPVWAISRVVFDGDDVEITWANATNSFTNVWDDRLTYTYD